MSHIYGIGTGMKKHTSEWFEGLYKLAFSKPYIESISWFDMIDPYVYMETEFAKSREEQRNHLMTDEKIVGWI